MQDNPFTRPKVSKVKVTVIRPVVGGSQDETLIEVCCKEIVNGGNFNYKPKLVIRPGIEYQIISDPVFSNNNIASYRDVGMAFENPNSVNIDIDVLVNDELEWVDFDYIILDQ